MNQLRRLNERLDASSLEKQAVIGGCLIAVIAFAFSLSRGIPWAIGTAAITGCIVGTAYYLGLRVANRNAG